MPKKTKSEDSIFKKARLEAGLTRAEAAEKMHFSESTLEKIERGSSEIDAYAVSRMAEAYHRPDLANHYCSALCPIGRDSVPTIEVTDLSQIVLNLLSNLRSIEREKENLIDITCDGVISDDELEQFSDIYRNLERMSITVEALRLWTKHTISTGKIDQKKLTDIRKRREETLLTT